MSSEFKSDKPGKHARRVAGDAIFKSDLAEASATETSPAESTFRAPAPLAGSSVPSNGQQMHGLRQMGRNAITEMASDDVARTRERHRRHRLRRLAVLLFPVATWLLLRFASGSPVKPGLPNIPDSFVPFMPGIALVLIMGVTLLLPMMAASRSPHVLYRPSEINVRMSDVRGIDVVAEEVQRSLELFLLHKTFQDQMGGQPRKAILFEGPPGTGKTLMAKALAGEASVPFLFVSSSAFQSMYHGATNRKIRSYFRALRKAAREEGGAIGFIEEIDAIGAARAGMGGSGGREGIAGVVNELLIQLQSFDEPTRGAKVAGWWIDKINRWLPANHQVRKRSGETSNYLVIGATNRAADLDPALLRPGRFDRSIFFDLPSRKGREEILEFYLEKKSHHDEVDLAKVHLLSASCQGYSPAMLENLLNEALVWALRRGDQKLNWDDIQRAKMAIEIGLAQPVEYTIEERRLIATHEAGHATVAYLVGRSRTLDVLSIIKRKSALGLLQHSDLEERFTQTQSEIRAFIQIAFGGLVAEEIFFGEVSTGPSGDLEVATRQACAMVGSLGMAGSFISYESMNMQHASNTAAKVLATDWGRDRVNEILDETHAQTKVMLTQYRHIVEALRDALLERDELIDTEILDVIRAADPDALDVAERLNWRSRSSGDRRRFSRLGIEDFNQEATNPPLDDGSAAK